MNVKNSTINNLLVRIMCTQKVVCTPPLAHSGAGETTCPHKGPILDNLWIISAPTWKQSLQSGEEWVSKNGIFNGYQMEEKQILLVVILVLNQLAHGDTLRRNGAVGKCFSPRCLMQ